jgi:ankyrin repeat protein
MSENAKSPLTYSYAENSRRYGASLNEPEPPNVKESLRSEADNIILYSLLGHIIKDNRSGVEKIISSNPKIINEYSDDGYTPLMLAVSHNKKEIVNDLLNNGADVNKRIRLGNYKGLTALHLAIISNNIEIAQDLLRRNTVFMMNGPNIKEDYLSKSRDEWREEMIGFINVHVKDPALLQDFLFAINMAVRTRDVLQGPTAIITKENLNRFKKAVSKKFPKPNGGSTQRKRTPRRRKVVQTRKKRY